MDFVQCSMGDDYYDNEYCYESDHGEYYVPRELFDKWSASEAAWRESQAEIGEFLRNFHAHPRRKPEIGIWQMAWNDVIINQLRSDIARGAHGNL